MDIKQKIMIPIFLGLILTVSFFTAKRFIPAATWFLPAVPTPTTGALPPGVPVTPAAVSRTIVLNASLVSKHNTPSDCWVVVEGNVYDATASDITGSCGKETAVSDEQAFRDMVYIGTFNGTIPDNAIPKAVIPTPAADQ